MNKLQEDSIVVMGPAGAGKSTITYILERYLSIESLHTDEYGKKLANSRKIELPNIINYSKDIKTFLKRRELLTTLVMENINIDETFILDTGADFVYMSKIEELLELKKELLKYKNRILLLPNKDLEISYRNLKRVLAYRTRFYGDGRHKHLIELQSEINRFLLESKIYDEFDPQVIYTNGKTENETAKEVIAYIKRR